VLPKAHRLRRSSAFAEAIRHGTRVGSPALVLHLLDQSPRGESSEQAPALVGFVVTKAVGRATVRNTVKRRLRAAMRDRLDRLPTGCWTVVRANPAAAQADFAALARELDSCLARLEDKRGRMRAQQASQRVSQVSQ
jgi:ribonuclease P protein component